MKLKQEFIVHHSGEESMLIPMENAGFSGIVTGNTTLGIIFDCMKEDTTEELVVKQLKEKFDDRSGKIESDVKKVLGELRKIGAIEE